MQFKLAKSYRYWWPVTVRVPDPTKAGEMIEQTLRLQLEPQSRDAALAAQERADGLTKVRDLIDHEIEQTLLVVRGWDSVVDDDGEIVPFSPDALRAALQHTWFRTAVSRAIAESLNGEAARLGN